MTHQPPKSHVYPEDGSSIFRRNVASRIQAEVHTAQQLRLPQSKYFEARGFTKLLPLLCESGLIQFCGTELPCCYGDQANNLPVPLALSIFFPILLWRFLSSQLLCVHCTLTVPAFVIGFQFNTKRPVWSDGVEATERRRTGCNREKQRHSV
jgi:hypothetical protein